MFTNHTLSMSFSMSIILLLASSVSADVDLFFWKPPSWTDTVVVSDTRDVFRNTGNIYANETCYLSFYVGNQGTNTSGAFYIEVWDLTTNERMGRAQVDPLASNYAKPFLNIETIFGSGGWHSLSFRIDPDDQVVESPDSNNEYSLQVYVNVAPDLWSQEVVVTNIVGSFINATEVYTGQQMYIPFVVNNVGSESTVVDFWIELWDVTTNELIFEREYNPLDSGTELTWWEVPWIFKTSGQHTLRLTVDSKNNVVESNENNNVYTKQIYVNSSKPVTPTLISPPNEAINVSITPTLQTSIFTDPDEGDTHANSQWQVDNNSGFTSPEWDSGQSYAASTQATVPLGKLNWNTKYYWRVRYKDNQSKWSNWSSSRYFTTKPAPPSKATNPTPHNYATDQSINVNLSWSSSSNATSYNVYFGTDPKPDASEFKENQTQNVYDPGTLLYGTMYFWRIDVVNNEEITEGDIWSFTTEELHARKILYVDRSAPLGGDGDSWNGAFKYLQDALSYARLLSEPVEIRIAQGTYRPDQGAGVTLRDRHAKFELVDGITIRGGYAGRTGADPSSRNRSLYQTILSGDLEDNDEDIMDPEDYWTEPSRQDNSYRIMEADHLEGKVTLDQLTFSAGYGVEKVTSSHDSVGTHVGAGLMIEMCDALITDCTFKKNAAGHISSIHGSGGGGGGGICIYPIGATVTLSGCIFEENWGRFGSAMMFNCFILSIGEITLHNCEFRHNYADSSTIYVYLGTFAMADCVISENVAGEGGGVSAQTDRFSADNCIFSNNFAGRGGAIEFIGSTANLTNCILVENVVNESFSWPGGAIFSNASTVLLNNCTIASNSAAKGNGIGTSSQGSSNQDLSSIEIVNSILWNGTDEIAMDDNSHITINYSTIQGSWPGTGNKNLYPQFKLLGYRDINGTPNTESDDLWMPGDYHLLSSSPCIDAGDPESIADPENVDIDGDVRIINGRVDMGADEYMPE